MVKRDLVTMAILMIVTLGFYFIYWAIKTKNELKQLTGLYIPTGFLMVLPLVNFYFWYKYSIAYAKQVRNNDNYIGYFLLASLLPWAAIFIMQSEINKLD